MNIFWASGIVGLAPIVVAVIVWWSIEIADALGPTAQTTAIASLLLALLILLFGYGFKTDGPPLGLPDTVDTGAYAGMKTSTKRATEVDAFMALSEKWVGPTTSVTVVDMPGAYLLTGGLPLTNVVWLDPGPFDEFTVAYLDRTGKWPEVVFVPLLRLDQPPSIIETSPFLSAVLKRYKLAERSLSAGVAVFTSSDYEPPAVMAPGAGTGR